MPPKDIAFTAAVCGACILGYFIFTLICWIAQ